MDGIELSDDRARIDLARVHAWLSDTYWSPGIPLALVERGFRHSTAVCGAYATGAQIGVARVLSDTVRFAYIGDVFVDPAWRNRGVARAMVRHLMELPVLAECQSWYLLTRDAHGVYAGLGFAPFAKPEDLMTLRRQRPW
ncbi:MAG TPA: GNAT family N-acetyltransferase [Planctomycetota bacterium]|nr:GNAT family N-acetyltransferase [Planctomycetota bacterium]